MKKTQKLGKREEKYTAFINSKEWKAIRIRVINIRGGCCEKCGCKNDIHIHHLNYKRFGGKEEDTDLQVLCKKCHMEVHGLAYDGKTQLKKKKKKKGMSLYRQLAFKKYGLREKGNRGRLGLAKTIALQEIGRIIKFKSKKDAMNYIKMKLYNEIKAERAERMQLKPRRS